jgi:hypothetical protein
MWQIWCISKLMCPQRTVSIEKNVKINNCYIPYTITTIIPRIYNCALQARFCFSGIFINDTIRYTCVSYSKTKNAWTDIFIGNIFISTLYKYASLEVCHSYQTSFSFWAYSDSLQQLLGNDISTA